MTLNKLKIAIGADHRGYQLKEYLQQHVTRPGTTIEWLDVGAYNDERSDYPEFAIAAAKAMLENKADVAILICGTGVGMAVAANRFHGVYAALVWNTEIARLAKEDDHANVLVLPSDFVASKDAVAMVHAWLTAEYKQGRYEKRIAMIDAIKTK